MDSPKRKAQKNKDYRRHRMMRLLNRRKATAQEAMSEIAERELMRRLRITPLKKFEDGKDAEYDAGVLDNVVITGNRRPANIVFDKDTGNYYRESTGDVVTPVNKLVEDDPSTWSFTDKNGTTFTPHGSVFNSNQGEIRLAEEAPFLSNNYIKLAAHNYMSELAYDINNNRVVGGKYTMPAIALAPVLSNPVGEAAINSAFGAHGAEELSKGNITPEALMEVAPLGQLAKPLYKGVLEPGMRLYNSPLTGNWTRIGNREYRFKPGYLGMNGAPIESRKIKDYSAFLDTDAGKMRNIFEEYEKSLTQYKGSKLSSNDALKFKYEPPVIDFDNLVKDDFIDYISKQTGRAVKRVPIKDTKHGDIYNEGFAFVDENGKELAHIAGSRKNKNVWVESSYVDPEFRHQGLGKQMYFDLNDHVYSLYGTTLHSSPMQRVGSTGAGMSPSNRLWKSLRDNGLSSVEGEGFNKYDVMAEPSRITTAYRTPEITAENAASVTPELDAAYKAAVESGDRPEALRLLEQAYLRSGIPRTDVTVTPEGHAVGWYHGSEWGNHTIFDSSAMNATIGGTSAHGRIKGNFLTTDVPSAMRYAGSSSYSSADVPEYTSPITFGEKIKKLFGRYKPRRLYPAERVGNLAPKPERLFDTEGKAPINHLDKTDRVVYPMYVNPGEDVMALDFQGKPWSQSPVIFPNNFYLNRHIRDDIAKTFRDEIIPYKDYEAAYKAWIEDPINIRHGDISLDKKYFDDGIRSIEGFNSAPRYERVRLVEELVPNTTNGAVQTAAKEGKTSVLMRNVIDSNGGPEGVGYAIDDFVTLKPNQQKLADITYDDNGRLIPLSQRFNWFKDDIRYGLLPFGIGFGGLGLVNKNSRFK